MGTEPVPEPTPALPKLSFLPLPSQSPEPAGMKTPPLRPPAAVPFVWEEAPGKPRSSGGPSSSSFRGLDLPPRLLPESAAVDSPTTVLDGPYVARSASSASLRWLKDRSPETLLKLHSQRKEKDKVLGFSRSRKAKVAENCSRKTPPSALTPSSSYPSPGEADDAIRVRITRFRRSGSFLDNLNITSSTSHFWGAISGSFKRVFPWRFGKATTHKHGGRR